MPNPIEMLPVDPAVLAHPRTAAWPGRVVRGCAIAVLLLAALTVVGSAAPAWRSTPDLVTDLTAGRVTSVQYSPDARIVRWVDDRVLWRQAVVDVPAGPSGTPPEPGHEEEWLRERVAASGLPLRVADQSETGKGAPWPWQVPWIPLRVAAICVWFGALVQMLGRGDHRVANRWAWFWLFTLGQVGVLLYLVREPVPIWRRTLPVTGRRPTTGGAGFAQAVLLALGTGVLSLGIAELMR